MPGVLVLRQGVSGGFGVGVIEQLVTTERGRLVPNYEGTNSSWARRMMILGDPGRPVLLPVPDRQPGVDLQNQMRIIEAGPIVEFGLFTICAVGRSSRGGAAVLDRAGS